MSRRFQAPPFIQRAIFTNKKEWWHTFCNKSFNKSFAWWIKCSLQWATPAQISRSSRSCFRTARSPKASALFFIAPVWSRLEADLDGNCIEFRLAILHSARMKALFSSFWRRPASEFHRFPDDSRKYAGFLRIRKFFKGHCSDPYVHWLLFHLLTKAYRCYDAKLDWMYMVALDYIDRPEARSDCHLF